MAQDCDYCLMMAETLYGRRENSGSPFRLLTDNNPKIAKGIRAGWYTAVLHFVPSDVSGFIDTCPFASPDCSATCLNTSGQGGIPMGKAKGGSSKMAKERLARLTEEADRIAPKRRKDIALNEVIMARLRRTSRWVTDRPAFVVDLKKDLRLVVKRAKERGLRPAVRLNGTSDIVWEHQLPELFAEFPEIQFYDYTKIPARARKWAEGKLPANYHLTFSRSEVNADAILKLPPKVNIAVVFNTKPKRPLPTVWAGKPVIDGDETDLRFLDPPGVIIGLRAKGRLKEPEWQDSGFVVRTNPTLLTLTNPRHNVKKPSARALAAYRRFHDCDPSSVRSLGRTGPELIALGELIEVVYKPTRGARRGPAFVHRFGRGAVVAATVDGDELVLLPSPKRPFRVDWNRGIVG